MKKAGFKKIISGLLVAALLGALAGCGTETGKTTGENKTAPDVVNIGVQTLVTPELVARSEKIYEEYLGTKVNLVQFDSGADVNKAFSSGSIDIAMFGSSPASLGVAKDLGYEVFWYFDVIGSAESLVATPKSGASTLKDLKGKIVATPFASTAHYSLLNALAAAGLTSSDIELLDMQPNDIYAAWNRGDIDAAYVWNPVLGQIKEGASVITDSAKLAEEGIVTADVGAVRKAFAKDYPEVVVGYVKAQLYALDIYEKDNEKAIKAIAAAAGITEKEAASQVLDFTYPSGKEQIGEDYLGTSDKVGKLAQILKNTADFHVSQGTIESAPALSVFQEAVTGEFVEKALAE